jgi:hypothetical protein
MMSAPTSPILSVVSRPLLLKLMVQRTAQVLKSPMIRVAQNFFATQGYRTFRVTNTDVNENLDGVPEALPPLALTYPLASWNRT